MRQPIHGAVTPEPPPACRGPTYPQMTCGSQTHSRQKTLTQPGPLLAPGTALQGTPGASVLHIHTDGTQTPRSCRNAGPLSPLKQVAGPASSEERLGGGFSSPRSGVALTCSHSNRWVRSLRCSNRPASRKGSYPTRTEQLLAPGPAAGAPGQLVSHTQGHRVPVPMCARAGRGRGQCSRSQPQARAPRALSGAHPLEMHDLCTQRAPGPTTFLAPAATHAYTAAPPPRAICWPH